MARSVIAVFWFVILPGALIAQLLDVFHDELNEPDSTLAVRLFRISALGDVTTSRFRPVIGEGCAGVSSDYDPRMQC